MRSARSLVGAGVIAGALALVAGGSAAAAEDSTATGQRAGPVCTPDRTVCADYDQVTRQLTAWDTACGGPQGRVEARIGGQALRVRVPDCETATVRPKPVASHISYRACAGTVCGAWATEPMRTS